MPDALYREVLTACAVTKTDDLGYFYPGAVRVHLEEILKREYKVEAYARHLASFCEDQRGAVLLKDSKSSKPRYRFAKPMMVPYIIIKGVAEKLITRDSVIHKAPDGQLFIP